MLYQHEVVLSLCSTVVRLCAIAAGLNEAQAPWLYAVWLTTKTGARHPRAM
jgi:hypothetical protein